MKIEKLLDTKAGAALVMGAVVIGAIYYFKKDITDGVNSAGQAINPVNNDNIFNQGVLAVGQKITGDSNWSLGGWIYDVTHPKDDDNQYIWNPAKPPVM